MLVTTSINLQQILKKVPTNNLTDEVDVIPPRSTQTVTAPFPIPILPVRVTRARPREALPLVLYSESVMAAFGCQRCTGIDSLNCASLMIIVAAVWDGSAGLVYEASSFVIRRNWGKKNMIVCIDTNNYYAILRVEYD